MKKADNFRKQYYIRGWHPQPIKCLQWKRLKPGRMKQKFVFLQTFTNIRKEEVKMKKSSMIFLIIVMSMGSFELLAQHFDYHLEESPAVSWNGVQMIDARMLALGLEYGVLSAGRDFFFPVGLKAGPPTPQGTGHHVKSSNLRVRLSHWNCNCRCWRCLLPGLRSRHQERAKPFCLK